MNIESPLTVKQITDISFTKVDDGIYEVKKDRGNLYNNAKFVGSDGVISMLNNNKTKVLVLDREERRILCKNFK
ncbi:hypothetical protein [Paenibacillus sp. QZ-Y1]|uniref:hypothetical protein n=1 Tax=Paenibacillus sp. QZ-Y1 TaxID=3414511 RepID=UPI003F794F1E